MSENMMLDFLDTVERLARFIIGLVDLLRVRNVNLFAHRQQSQYPDAESCLQGMPVVSGGESILQFLEALVVPCGLHLCVLQRL
jgi:hypothetical protein